MPVTSIFNGTAIDEIGADNGGTGNRAIGEFLWEQTRDASVPFAVVDGKIMSPAGGEFRAAGMNVTTGMEEANSWATGATTLWNHDGMPRYLIQPDIWNSTDNLALDDGNRIFPGGGITAHRAFSAEASTDSTNYPGGSYVEIPDRAYALNGFLSTDALNAGITQPEDHWNTPLVRATCILRAGGQTYSAADSLTTAHTIPRYRANALAMEALGLTVVMQDHGFYDSAQNPLVPAAIILDPTLATSDGAFSDNEFRDTCEFLDDMVANLDPQKSWLSLPNEPYSTERAVAYDDFVVTLIRRARSAGWTGVISVPLSNYSSELGPVALGEYDTLMDRLETHGVGENLIWEWHNYGAHVHTGEATTVYTYDEINAHLSACRNGVAGSGRKYAIWMGEYGTPVPNYLGTADERANEERIHQAVQIMATDTFGTALGEIHGHVCPTWWHATGDHYYAMTYSLTYGLRNKGNEFGPDPIPSDTEDTENTNPGTMPFWDITSEALRDEWCTPGGLAHWDIAHRIADQGSASIPGEVKTFFDARTLAAGTTGFTDSAGVTWAINGAASLVSNTELTLPVRQPVARRSNIVDYDEDGTDQPVTGVAIIGEGEGNDMELHFRQLTQGVIPLWEAKLTAKDEGDPLTLIDYGNACLAQNAVSRKQYTITLDPELDPGIDDLISGANIRVVINDQFTQVDETFWIGRKRVTLSKDQDELIILEVTQ